ncbi:MAG: DUF4129 domain-containing transglutaminase family protein [Limisphaerales bacterium]
MKTPPLLIGVALLFWGMQNGFFGFALAMAGIVEATNLFKSRWEFSEKEYQRIFDLCALLFVGAVAIANTSDEVRVPALALAQWLPFVFFPIVAAQCYGNQDQLSVRTFSWFLRRRKGGLGDKHLNVSYLYFGICMVSASAAAPGRSSGELIGPFGARTFYFVVAAILIWALMSIRPRRVHSSVWVALVSCVAVFGYFGQVGLHSLQRYLENALTSWVGRFARSDLNLMESQTALGRIGRVKLSGKIVWRVETVDGKAPPMLLRQASYDNYGNTLWRATRYEMGQVSIETNDVFRIVSDVKPDRSVRISGYLHRGEGILPLPPGTVELRDLQVATVETNGMGVAKANEGLNFIRFYAKSTPTFSYDTPATPDDIADTTKEDQYISQIADELGLLSPGKSFDEKLRIIHQFFQDNFSYSTFITHAHVDPSRQKTALAMFLTETRSGHCEYFATASVLLARKAGIPARYATGFAVQETAGDGKYVIRERHAHAWTLVYRPETGNWEDFDTTPASWDEIESQRASMWEPVSDLWSRLVYEFSKWRYSKTSFREYAVWLLVPLVLILVWRIVFNRKRKRTISGAGDENSASWPGLDSELYQMEAELAQRGLVRAPSETLQSWKNRVHALACMPPEDFENAVELHARYRFDPEGLTDGEREILRTNVNECLRALRQLPKDQALAEANSQAG